MKANSIELLAPAGNMECLRAAVLNGADAVYFGGGSFNARRGADNFTGDALKEAIDYCRLRGVKTHITLNTLLFDRELEEALRFATKLLSLRADAVIVQDPGLARLIRSELPELCVHASTQMGIHSLGGLEYCGEMGISRAVLAREVPLEEIRLMHENSPVELEFFCHGALCMGFSGSCLYSSMAGERSGNRGTCAQPCRKNATVLHSRAGSGEFALSTNDICMIDELGALIGAGICSFKIEGRMKSPEYVATVTRIYRAALDGKKPAEARSTLFEIFNRGDFSTAHIKGDTVTTGHVGRAKPQDALIAQAHESVRAEKPVRPLSARLSLEVGKTAKLTLSSSGFEAEAIGSVCEPANNPIDEARLREQLKKLGGTPFYLEDCGILGGGFISIGELNALRREGVALLSAAITGEPSPERVITKERVFAQASYVGPADAAPIRYVRVRTVKEAQDADADIIGLDPVFPGRLDPAQLKGIRNKLLLVLPNVIMTDEAREAYEALLSSGIFRGVEVNNISHIRMGSALPLRIAGIGMNVTNSVSASEMLRLGFTHFMPSLEMTRPQLSSLAEGFGQAMIVNTLIRAPLMQLLHCPVKEYRGCRRCEGSCGELTDGDGRSFPLENVRFPGGSCLVRMLNSAVTDIREAFTKSGIRAYGEAITPDRRIDSNITRGHWNRPVD